MATIANGCHLVTKSARITTGFRAFAPGTSLRSSEAAPYRHLLLPHQALQHPPEIPLGDRLAAGEHLEVEDVLLCGRGQEQQVHHLGESGAGEAVGSGHVGVVAELASLDPGFDVVGQGQEPGDTGRVWRS